MFSENIELGISLPSLLSSLTRREFGGDFVVSVMLSASRKEVTQASVTCSPHSADDKVDALFSSCSNISTRVRSECGIMENGNSELRAFH
jgi:hypothetical protein